MVILYQVNGKLTNQFTIFYCNIGIGIKRYNKIINYNKNID